MDRGIAVPEARGGGRVRFRIRESLVRVIRGRARVRVRARTERDQFLVWREPVAQANDLRVVAVSLVTLPGGRIVRFHGFAAPFSTRALQIASSGRGSITI